MEKFKIRAVDYHTGGGPFRIVTDVPSLRSATVAEKRLEAIDSPVFSNLRSILCSEPRGHAAMHGGFVVEPDDEGADFGVLFWHRDGYATACGHGTIALGTWAINTGRVSVSATGVTDVVLDVPSGRVTARVTTSPDQQVTSVDFVNIPSYQLNGDFSLRTSAGLVNATVAFGGALFAHIDVADIGLAVVPANLPRLIELSREVKVGLNSRLSADSEGSPWGNTEVFGVIFFEDHGNDPAGNPVQVNVNIYGDGDIDRSPCGSGTCSRLAVLAAEGRVHENNHLVHKSIVGSTFTGRIVARGTHKGLDTVTPMVSGVAYETGEHLFIVDPADELTPGFVLR